MASDGKQVPSSAACQAYPRQGEAFVVQVAQRLHNRHDKKLRPGTEMSEVKRAWKGMERLGMARTCQILFIMMVPVKYC